MEKQGKRALPRSAWPHDLAGFEIIDDQLSFPKNLMIRQGQYQHLRSSSPSLRWDNVDEKIPDWDWHHSSYDFSHFRENWTLIFNLQYFKKLIWQKKISWTQISTKYSNLGFSSTVYHLTHQPSPPNKDVFRHVSLCFSDKNLELMMHSGQLLHSGIFFSNSTKVFVMTHFFTNGFETRTCTSFPNSLKCTTHSNVVLRLGLVRLRSPMEGVGEGGHNQGVILAKIAIFFS